MGTPALVVGYQHKTEGVLGALGLEDLYLGGFESVGVKAMKDSCERMWHQKEEWIKKIDSALTLARQEIHDIFQKRLTFLSS